MDSGADVAEQLEHELLPREHEVTVQGGVGDPTASGGSPGSGSGRISLQKELVWCRQQRGLQRALWDPGRDAFWSEWQVPYPEPTSGNRTLHTCGSNTETAGSQEVTCVVVLQQGLTKGDCGVVQEGLGGSTKWFCGQETGVARGTSDSQKTHKDTTAREGARGGDFGWDRSLVYALWPGCRLPPCGRQESASFGCHECARTDRWCGQIWALGIGLVACEVQQREHHRGPHNWRRWLEIAIWAGYNAGQGPSEATLSIHDCLTAGIMRYYQGALYQRGYGLASLWRGIFKTAIPLKSAGRAATRVGLRTGLGVVRDAARGQNLGESLKRRLVTEVAREIVPPLQADSSYKMRQRISRRHKAQEGDKGKTCRHLQLIPVAEVAVVRSSGCVPCTCAVPTAVKDCRSTHRWRIPWPAPSDAVCLSIAPAASLLSRRQIRKSPPQRTGAVAAATVCSRTLKSPGPGRRSGPRD